MTIATATLTRLTCDTEGCTRHTALSHPDGTPAAEHLGDSGWTITAEGASTCPAHTDAPLVAPMPEVHIEDTPGITLVYAQEDPPESYSALMFLVGPTPRTAETQSWRPDAVRALAAAGYQGVIVIPEPRPGTAFTPEMWAAQTVWETLWLDRADVILAWVPREMRTMPALTTNIEFGERLTSGRMVFGAPDGAASVRYLFARAETVGLPTARTLDGTVAAALALLGEPWERSGAERSFPLVAWRMPEVRAWYQAQHDAGHEIVSARIAFRVGAAAGPSFLLAITPRVQVFGEDRVKDNETILVRPDMASVMLYRRCGSDPLATEVVFVDEYRSAVRNTSGRVRELPGGSGGEVTPLATACTELREETTVELPADRLTAVAARQVTAPLAAHRAHLYAVELSETEWQQAVTPGRVAGDGGTEVTTVQVQTVREVLASDSVDWATVGMILSALATVSTV